MDRTVEWNGVYVVPASTGRIEFVLRVEAEEIIERVRQALLQEGWSEERIERLISGEGIEI
jgi:hypothetical protein